MYAAAFGAAASCVQIRIIWLKQNNLVKANGLKQTENKSIVAKNEVMRLFIPAAYVTIQINGI